MLHACVKRFDETGEKFLSGELNRALLVEMLIENWHKSKKEGRCDFHLFFVEHLEREKNRRIFQNSSLSPMQVAGLWQWPPGMTNHNVYQFFLALLQYQLAIAQCCCNIFLFLFVSLDLSLWQQIRKNGGKDQMWKRTVRDQVAGTEIEIRRVQRLNSAWPSIIHVWWSLGKLAAWEQGHPP